MKVSDNVRRFIKERPSFSLAIARAIEAEGLLHRPKPVVGTTAKQQKVLDFIREFISENEFSPTTREIAIAMGHPRSIGLMQRHINNLVARGHLKRIPRTSRSISLVETD